MMDKQPSWVPDWVWREYVDTKTCNHALRFSNPDAKASVDGVVHFANPHDLLSVMEKLIADQACKSVWKALERRHGDTFKRYGHVLDDKGITHGEDFNALEAYYLGFDYFADTVCMALEGPQNANTLTSSQRKAAAQKISKLSDQLLHALEDTFSSDLSLLKMLMDVGMISLHINENPNQPIPSTDPSVIEGVSTLPQTLMLLSKGVKDWGEWKPPLARPNHPNARRLFFIRVITDWFLESCGSPMREQTLAITDVFFDCSDLDASVIQKLAPCSQTE